MGRDNWKIIRDRILADIAADALEPGAQLPTDSQFCQTFQAGRHSVRRAVAVLRVEGKLRVEQGRGIFVRAAPLIRYHIGRRARFRQNLLSQGIAPAGEQFADVPRADHGNAWSGRGQPGSPPVAPRYGGWGADQLRVVLALRQPLS